MQKTRVIFMGTPKIAATCLAAILNRSDVEVVAVVVYIVVEQLAVPQNPNVFMEDVEETASENALLNETGNPRKIRSHGGKQ